jgi:hypothetical protein
MYSSALEVLVDSTATPYDQPRTQTSTVGTYNDFA